MARPNVNIVVGGAQTPSYSKKTMVLKSNLSFVSQVTDQNTIYIIRWNFDLRGLNVIIPSGCLLKFEGGSISNGTLTGDQTILIYNQPIEDIVTATLSGTWKYSSDIDDSLGADNEPGTVKGRIKSLETEVGSDSTPNSIKGRIKVVEDEIGDDTTGQSLSGRVTNLENAVGSGGSVDSRIDEAKSEIIGNASPNYDTLGKLENKIRTETNARIDADVTLDSRVDELESMVGSGGTVDTRIAIEGAKHYLKEETYSRAETYDRQEIRDRISAEGSNHYLKNETYSKNELNNLITTPEQKYVTVTATAQTTDVTQVLPAMGSADTVYRVGNWNGTQFTEAVYSEYAWNGNSYVFLDRKQYNIDDEPNPESENILSSRGAANTYGFYQENPEFLEAHTDNDGQYLYGVKKNGDFDWQSGIPKHVQEYIRRNGYDEIMSSDNLLAMLLDNEDALINFRKKDGKLIELLGLESPEITSEHFVFKNKALKMLEDDLIKDGFNPSTAGKNLNILFVGSSSEQDYVAYVPPVLQEVLYDYTIIVGDMYVSGGEASDYVTLYKNNKGCSTYNEWTAARGAWKSYSNDSASANYRIEDILAKYRWDFIIFKGSDNSCRQLMRIIQNILTTSEGTNYPVAFVTDAMVARPGYFPVPRQDWSSRIEGAEERVKNVGFVDYIPIATAIENARSNDILKMTGTVSFCEPTTIDVPSNSFVSRWHLIRNGYTATLHATKTGGNGTVRIYASNSPEAPSVSDTLLFTLNDSEAHEVSIDGTGTSYIKIVNEGSNTCNVVIDDSHSAGNFMHYRDNQHLQSGLPVLIAGYAIVLKILEMTGNKDRGIGGSTFIPTTENCAAIGVIAPTNNDSSGLGHGAVCGIVDYLGSDNEHYDRAELTMINNVLYVTSTIYNNSPDGRSVTATVNGIRYKNIYAAQEIAVKAITHPDELVDCSNIVIEVPEKNN